MLTGVQVADTVVLVLDASAGVEVGTQQAWQMATDNDKPIAIFLNKMDRANASYRKVIDQLRQTFEATFVPIELPIRNGEQFEGVVDMITQTARTGSGKPTAPPADMAADIEEYRTQVVEYAAEGDDELMMKYFDGETLTEAEIGHGLQAGLAARKIVPVFCGSATANVAVRGFMHTIVETFPTPAVEIMVKNAKSGGDETLKGAANGPLAAQVFKTVNDQYGRLSFLRVWSGTLKGDSRAFNPRTGEEERITGLFSPRGKEQVGMSQALAGDIAAVVKLSQTQTGDTLCDKAHPVIVLMVKFTESVYAVALTPKTHGD
jgi:elongation factor G